MMRLKTVLLALALLALAGGADASERRDLTFEILSTGPFSAPVDYAAFAPGKSAASNRFEGRLVLEVDTGPAGYRERHINLFDRQPATERRKRLPPFDMAFVQDGADLIPTLHEPAGPADTEWRLFVNAGRVWNEPGDRGWSRAAIPFSLQEYNANCTHNGVLTFLYRTGGRISKVAWQIVSETCFYYKFDGWGLVDARYRRGMAPDRAAVIADHRRRVAARLPVRPIAALATDHPDLEVAKLALKGPADGDPPTVYGLVVDGVNYAGPCQTRMGDYPFCESVELPGYSTSKSLFAAVALMRLEKLYPGVSKARITDHVGHCARAGGWDGVTFADALNMATGQYVSRDESDENAPLIEAFFTAPNYTARLHYSCYIHPRRVEPGSFFKYHTTDTFVLGAAMSDFLRGKEGEGRDLYDDVVLRPLWRPLALGPSLDATLRTYDRYRQPLAGLGLEYHPDDIARLAVWLDGGALIDGRPALDQRMLAAALQRDPADRGLPAGSPTSRYNLGFWARDIGPLLGCPAAVWVPYMSGYGGISVVLLPHGVQYYYFSDGGGFDWTPAAVEAARIRNPCP
jgi:hypothetical protein